MKKTLFTTLCAVGASVLTASALTVLPGDPGWASPPSENSGGGSAAITDTAPRSGNGSIELFGDRTRFIGLGNPYDSTSNIGLLSELTAFQFDWMVAEDSAGSGAGASANYSPALRLHIWDGAQRSELIWERAYNPGDPVVKGTWYTSGIDDNYWRWQSGPGDSMIYNRSISDWSLLGYSGTAYIAGISVGVGSSAGAGFHGFADNIVLAFGQTSVTYNFEVSPTSSVPDGGATLLLLGAAFAGLAAVRRKLAA